MDVKNNTLSVEFNVDDIDDRFTTVADEPTPADSTTQPEEQVAPQDAEVVEQEEGSAQHSNPIS